LQDVNNTGPETLPVSVCNCFLYFTCKENILCLYNFLIQFYMFCWLYFIPAFIKKLKQEVLLDQCCLHLAKWSIIKHSSKWKTILVGTYC